MPVPSLPIFVAAQQHAQANPDKVAVIDATKKESFTYVQLLEDAAALRKQILEYVGLTASGDLDERRIAHLAPNGYDYVVTQWAVWMAGGISVPLCMYRIDLAHSADANICPQAHPTPSRSCCTPLATRTRH